MSHDQYGQTFKFARLDAARRLGRIDFEDRSVAASAIGISDRYLKGLESGEKRPSFEVLESMARAYGVLMGDLLPSQAPRGAQADAILGPIATLPPLHRDAFITQMAAFARITAAAITTAVDSAVMSRIDESGNFGVSSASPSSHHDQPSGVPGLDRVLEPEEGDDEEMPHAKQQRSVPIPTKRRAN